MPGAVGLRIIGGVKGVFCVRVGWLCSGVSVGVWGRGEGRLFTPAAGGGGLLVLVDPPLSSAPCIVITK